MCVCAGILSRVQAVLSAKCCHRRSGLRLGGPWMCHTGPHVALDFNGATPVMSDELRGPDDDALMTWGLRRDEMSGGIVLYWAARCAQLD